VPFRKGNQNRSKATFINHYKNARSLPLAPIEVKIHMCRGSAHMDCNGKRDPCFQKMPDLSAPNQYPNSVYSNKKTCLESIKTGFYYNEKRQ